MSPTDAKWSNHFLFPTSLHPGFHSRPPPGYKNQAYCLPGGEDAELAERRGFLRALGPPAARLENGVLTIVRGAEWDHLKQHLHRAAMQRYL